LATTNPSSEQKTTFLVYGIAQEVVFIQGIYGCGAWRARRRKFILDAAGFKPPEQAL
jgi:hypothetical protein